MSHLEIFLLLLTVLIFVVIWRFPRRRIALRHAIGVTTMARSFTELIPAGVTLPFYFSDFFWNAEDSQEDLALTLLQDVKGDLRKIAVITIAGLPPRPTGMLSMELRLILDRNKRLTVWTESKDARYIKFHGPYSVDG